MNLQYLNSLPEDAECLLRDIYRTMTFGVSIFEIRNGFKFVFANTAFAHFFQLDAADLPGRCLVDVLAPPLAQQLAIAMQACLETGQAATVESHTTAVDGTSCWLLHHIAPLRNQQGDIDRLICNCCDISDRKRVEPALRDLITGTTAVTGADLFPVLVNHLALTLEVDYVILAKQVGSRFYILASWPLVLTSPQELAGTPCEIVLHRGDYYQAAGVQESFPTDQGLQVLGAEGYYGVRLKSAEGTVLGHLCILHTRPLDALEKYEQILQSFAARVVLELERQQAETALRDSEERFQALAENMPGIIYRYVKRTDGAEAFLYISPNIRTWFGIEPGACERDAETVWQFVLPEDQVQLRQSLEQSRQTLQVWELEWRMRTITDEIRWLYGRSHPRQEANGDVIWDGLMIDVSDRKQAEAALRDSEERYRLVTENTTDLVCLHEVNGRFTYVSPSSEVLLGYQPSELIGRDPKDFFHPEDRDRLERDVLALVSGDKLPPTIYRFRARSGAYIWLETLAQPILDEQGQVVKLQTASRLITERIRAEEQLRYQASHDELTGLPNRNLLTNRLEHAIHRFLQQPEARYAVLFLDLDRFKVINDSLGHLAGDQLLVNVAQQLQVLVREGDMAARLGGDEFVILLESIDSLQTAFRVAERIRDELQLPQILGDRQIQVSTSIGIVFGSYAHQNAADLLRDADIAMYRAKNKGGGRYEVFDPVMHLRAVERLNLENDLRQAIESGAFVLYFQPIVSLGDGSIYGFEALARWQHPQRGLVPPQEFLPVAEETGMIVPLSNWVLQQACQQMATWQRAIPNARHLRLSVNLATQQFRQPDFVQQVQRILQTTGLAGESLILEFREGLLISDLRPMIARLEALRSLAIQLSIDDFGTGYSSLSHLHQFPLNMLKIAQALISAVQPEGESNPIASMVVALARQLNLVVVAEGIESIGQSQRLTELGCTLGQGYCFSAPLAASDVPALLASPSAYEICR